MRKLFLILLIIPFLSEGQTPLHLLIAKKNSTGNGYAYKRTITVDNTKVPNTDQTNFPVLFRNNTGTVNTVGTAVAWVSGDQFISAMAGQSIRINGTIYTVASVTTAIALVLTATAGTQSAVAYNDLPQFATVANGGVVQNSNGYDIIVTSDAAGTSILNFSISNYSATTGSLIIWVKVPTLHTGSADVLYLFYGNATISTFQGNVTGTWSSNYLQVLHLGDGTTLSAADATSNGNNGTIGGSADPAVGQIDGGANFDFVNDVITFSGVSPGTSFTVSLWIYPIASSDVDASIYTQGPTRGLYYRGSGTGARKLNYYQSGDHLSTTAITESTWNYVTVTANGTGIIFYLNGVADGSYSLTVVAPTFNTMGDDSGSETFRGRMDEVRISNTARSADFVKTSYNNQKIPQTFYSVGSQTAN